MSAQPSLETFQKEILSAFENSSSLTELEDLRVKTFGKQGSLTGMLKSLGTLPPEERKERGQELNKLRQSLTQVFENRRDALAEAEMKTKLAQENVDITLTPQPDLTHGSLHPFTEAMWELTQILVHMGFDVAEGPDVETQENNFDALNIPAHHPARQDHDTFYLEDTDAEGQNLVLRTHTSPVQIRTLKNAKPPIRIIAPGRTYRCDSDATHTPNFHQVEGLWIEEGITMAHLKGCLAEMLRKFFKKPDLVVRMRPSYFPFTEPSAEIDIGCRWENGQLILGGSEDWLEILGCGMVHRCVLENCGVDPKKHQGFAFGFGVERMAMLKYGIPDLRAFYEGNPLWTQHYGFGASHAFSALDQ